ncbi:MAG: SMP-30/gluconolactonase/LRE family protein [Candidatus Sumerlaeaceae bacterium]|nr:SMP-30/gluconolactonase/LRE family protein [Candidatus Sumerlaeaceae bacterium]
MIFCRLWCIAGLLACVAPAIAASEGDSMSSTITVEKIAEGFVFPEGPVWHPEGYLIFSDVHGATIEKIKPEGGSETWFSKGKKTNGTIMSPDGKHIYACCYSERELLEIDPKTREFRVLTNKCGDMLFNNVNDVAVDKAGHVFFTDPNWAPKPEHVQGIYRYSPKDGQTTLAAAVDKQPNGLVVSPDQQWLYVDRSGGHDIWRFRLSPNGELSEGQQWVKLEPKAEPDGMTIDSKGNLYVAQAGNGKLCVLSPEGKVLHLIPIVDRMATNCEFEGGNEKILYVTGGGKQGTRQGAVWKVRFP